MASFHEQMEPSNSTHSLQSARRSEIGSQYLVESGIYMSSFAATILISSLVALGVLMLTLVAALTYMLESCQSKGAGIVEQDKFVCPDSTCRSLTFQMELNNLVYDKEFLFKCEQYVSSYMIGGQYMRDIQQTLDFAEQYFSEFPPIKDSDVVLIDIDDILIWPSSRNSEAFINPTEQIEHIKDLSSKAIILFHLKLQNTGWLLIPFTRKGLNQWNYTTESLKAAGYAGWPSLVMRHVEEEEMESWEYIYRTRTRLYNEGLHVAGVISSKLDAFMGGSGGNRNFKLPSPIYHHNLSLHSE